MTESDYLAHKAGEFGEYFPGTMICPCCGKDYLDPEEKLYSCQEPNCGCRLVTPEEAERIEEEEIADAKRKESSLNEPR